MSANLNNVAMCTGTLARDAAVYKNDDGSRTVEVTVMCARANSHARDFVPVKFWFPEARGEKLIGRLKRNQFLTIVYEARQQHWIDAGGEKRYREVNVGNEIKFR